MSSRRRLQVALDARLISGRMGGIEQVVIGMAAGLSKLQGENDDYIFLAYEDADAFLRPYIGGSCRIVHVPSSPKRGSLQRAISYGLNSNRSVMNSSLAKLLYHVRKIVPRSNMIQDVLEREGIKLIHFLKQAAFPTSIPFIYQPHDLQHRHLPELFSPYELFARENMFRTFLHQAAMVGVTSTWGKNDIINQYNVSTDKVQVVPWAPVIGAYKDPTLVEISNLQTRLVLPQKFLYYPAQTWPHKNHIELFNALSMLKLQGVVLPLVCTGHLTDHYEILRNYAQQLGIDNQVQFLGFLPPEEMKAMFKLSWCVVIPSRFEAASFPLWESFLSGVPAACSNVTSLPAQAGDAALLFDPLCSEEIAAALLRLWSDESLRRELVSRGKERVSRFSWERVSLMFRAHYRRLSGHELDDVDLSMISIPPEL